MPGSAYAPVMFLLSPPWILCQTPKNTNPQAEALAAKEPSLWNQFAPKFSLSVCFAITFKIVAPLQVQKTSHPKPERFPEKNINLKPERFSERRWNDFFC